MALKTKDAALACRRRRLACGAVTTEAMRNLLNPGNQMKTTCLLKVFAITTGLLLAGVGCGHSSKQTTATITDQQSAQGQWSGYNTKRPDSKCTVKLTGNQFEYRGAEANDWSRGTFVLRENAEPKEMDLTIPEPAQQSNQKLFAIYQLEGDKMTVAMSSIQRPADFTPNEQTEVLHCTRE
jgi:uncharacterized protein (TIGR03067 family)